MEGLPSNQRIGIAMTYRKYGTLIASLSAVALMLAADESFARSGATARSGSAATHSASARSVAHAFRHHRRSNAGIFWPAAGEFYGPNGEPLAEAPPPASGDVRYTYTYDVPWDWAHRYPPAVAPSDRPYVPGCPAETVTVPGRDGTARTVNITRCY
jgi:hypothetical protein